jgi:3-hydroxyisobutyrate dehydrogenase-like beta-hydroxyacid dehydrogenase
LNERVHVLAVIGCGEVGRCYAAAFCAAGYAVALCDSAAMLAAQSLASGVSTPLHVAPGPWLESADIVISAVSGTAALDVLRASLPFLRGGIVYGDFTTASPEDKHRGGEDAGARGIAYVDAAIMGSISLTGACTPLLMAGAQAGRLASLVAVIGAPTRVLNDAQPGDAIRIKFLRSIFTKGLEALAVECLIAAEHQGVREQLLDQLADIDRTPLRDYLEMLIKTHVVHARRREREVAEAEQLLCSQNLPVNVLSGVRSRFAATVAALARDPPAIAVPDFLEALLWLVRSARDGDLSTSTKCGVFT